MRRGLSVAAGLIAWCTATALAQAQAKPDASVSKPAPRPAAAQVAGSPLTLHFVSQVMITPYDAVRIKANPLAFLSDVKLGPGTPRNPGERVPLKILSLSPQGLTYQLGFRVGDELESLTDEAIREHVTRDKRELFLIGSNYTLDANDTRPFDWKRLARATRLSVYFKRNGTPQRLELITDQCAADHSCQ